MTKFKIAIAVLLASLVGASAAQRITALVTITNSAGTLTNQQFTVNGNTRYWTNVVYIPSTQVLTNYTESSAKTNLFRQIGTYPFTSVTLVDNETNSFKLIGASDLAMVVTPSTGWATVSYSTQTVSTLYGVRVPISGEPNSGMQNYIASEIITGLNLKGTNALLQSSVVASNMVGLTNAQTIIGAKIFTNKTSRFDGILSNSPAISGTVVGLTNGIWTNGIIDHPYVTNAILYGNNTVAGTLDVTGTLGFGGFASTISSDGSKFTMTLETSGYPVYLGSSGIANGVVANEAYLTNGLTSASVTTTNLNVRGPSTFANTNNLPANADIAYARYAVSSLANGNNAAVPVGTNVFIEVSGPSGAFTINGIAAANAQRDGKIIYIINQTGQDMTIAHQSGTDPTAANRIITMTGADRATTGNGAATLIYSGSASRWILVSFDP